MSKRWAKERRVLFRDEEEAVRDIVNAWAPITDAPHDEYDCLVHKILSALHNGESSAQLERLVEHEVSDHFGLSASSSEVTRVAEQISTWRQSRAKR